MKYSRYNDPAALLIELCLPFTDKELDTLARIGAKMNNDPEFSRAYTLEVKNYYLKNIHAIKDNTYILQHFENLNFSICERIASNTKTPKVLLPEYININNTNTDQRKVTALREKIYKALHTRNPKE